MPSRICSAISFSFYGLSKDVIKLNLVMCLGSRDFIITQEGLKGFLLRVHDNFNSLIYELKVSQDFAWKIGIFSSEAERRTLASELYKLSE